MRSSRYLKVKSRLQIRSRNAGTSLVYRVQQSNCRFPSWLSGKLMLEESPILFLAVFTDRRVLAAAETRAASTLRN